MATFENVLSKTELNTSNAVMKLLDLDPNTVYVKWAMARYMDILTCSEQNLMRFVIDRWSVAFK